MVKSRMLCVSNPGLMLFKFSSVRTSRPAPERAKIASATWATTRPLPRFSHGLVDAPVASAARLSFSAGVRSRRTPRDAGARRSEEHTSELQSRFDLVCRLLLEKKKKTSHDNPLSL